MKQRFIVIFQIVMEYCGAGSVADIMKLRNKVVSTDFCIFFSCYLFLPCMYILNLNTITSALYTMSKG